MTDSHIGNSIKQLVRRKAEVDASDMRTHTLFDQYITAFKTELRTRKLDRLV